VTDAVAPGGAAAEPEPTTPADRSAGVSVPGSGSVRASDRRIAELGVLAVMVLWGGNFIVVKSAVAVLPPVGFTFLRFALASATLLLLLRWREGSVGLPRRDFVSIALLGALGFGAYQILWTTGLTTVAAGDSALIIAATPVLVAVLAVIARSDVLTPLKLAGVLVSFAGVAIVIASGPGLSIGGSLIGEAITLAAAGCWAIYTAFAAPYLRMYSPLRATTWATVAGTVVLAPIAMVQLSSLGPVSLGPDIAFALLYTGLLAAGISNVIVMNGVKVVGPTRTAALQFLVPGLAVVFAAVFLSEPIRFGQVIGGVVIVAGVLLTRVAAAGRRMLPARG
jgi:drug/metabolite transporter (DMT)-like permease